MATGIVQALVILAFMAGTKANERFQPDWDPYSWSDQPADTARASGENGPRIGPAPAIVVRRSTRR